MSLDLNAHDSYTVTALAAIAARTSTFTGTGFDTLDYEGKLQIVQHAVLASAGTTPTLNGKIQDSADNSSFADITGATFTEITDATGTLLQAIGVDKARRYIRYVGTIAGTSTPTFTFGVTVRGRKKYVR